MRVLTGSCEHIMCDMRNQACVCLCVVDGLVKRLEELEKTAELYKGDSFIPLLH